jgi:hypothetical protein
MIVRGGLPRFAPYDHRKPWRLSDTVEIPELDSCKEVAPLVRCESADSALGSGVSDKDDLAVGCYPSLPSIPTN